MKKIQELARQIRSIHISKGVCVTFVVALLFTGLTAVAVDTEITACVNNKTGSVKIINFLGGDCAKTETKMAWNIQGLQGEPGAQGPKGDTGEAGLQGEPGLSAQHGAGNIAFTYSDISTQTYYLLKTDGTVWMAYLGNTQYTQILQNEVGRINNIPIPISDIIVWQYSTLVDKNGNYWFFPLGSPQNGWRNLGPLPS